MCEHGAFWERKTVKNIHPFRVCDCFLGMEPSTLGISLTMGKPRSLATCQIFCRAKQFDTVDLCFFSANMLLIDEQRIVKSSSPASAVPPHTHLFLRQLFSWESLLSVGSKSWHFFDGLVSSWFCLEC